MNGDPAVVQIVPRLGSPLDGVADYATALATALHAAHGIPPVFLCGDPRVLEGGLDAGIRALSVDTRSADGFCRALRNLAERTSGARPVLLLHFVNYGYADRGCPFWLVEGLKAWKRVDPRSRLVTMFHELYASGPPWRSSFWLSPVQRHLSRELFRLSDACVTNREQSRNWLSAGRRQSQSGVTVMPVFSSIGESSGLEDWSRRSRRLVVAGRSGALHRAYGACRSQLIAACRALDIDEIVDAGARSDPVPLQVEGVPVRALGHLPPAELRGVLASARAGFVDYPSDYLGKSTVFAAYAAHGLLPVVSWRRGEDEAGLKEGVNYWVPAPGAPAPRDPESIATQARTWYADHRLEIQVREYASLLRGGAG